MQQDKRVALVVGNGNYKHTSWLPNPPNDAVAMAAALERLDFQVLDGNNLDFASFAGRIRDFGRALREAHVALLFYAGHGLQVKGENYAVPIDAALEHEADVQLELIAVQTILAQMEVGNRTSIVILDACRNNPLARNLARAVGTRSAAIGEGLGRLESGIGTYIAFATSPNKIALDGGSGSNSPFTAALLRHIETPGLTIADVMMQVRREVIAATEKMYEGAQVPWDNSSLTAPFYFKRPVTSGPQQPTPPNPTIITDRAERDWQRFQIAETEDVPVIEAYCAQYYTSDPLWAGRARQRLEVVRALIADRAERERERNAAEALRRQEEEEDRRAGIIRVRVGTNGGKDEVRRIAPGSGERVALVIGNSVYEHAAPLKNPANDARAIGAALTRLGFTGARPKFNLKHNDFLQALKQFRADAEGADMAAIYFAGHGIEVDDSNFLIPVDAKLLREGDVEFETVPLNQSLRTIERANRLGLIILDACRDNPFRQKLERSRGKRSFGRGLREVKVSGDNMLVAYAAEQGTFALDGAGGNSPFAEALLAHMEKPGLEIAMLFRQVRDDVLNRTGRAQKPYVYASLGGADVFLKPPIAPEVELPQSTIVIPPADFRPPTNGPFTFLPNGVFAALTILLLLLMIMFVALPTNDGPPQAPKEDLSPTPRPKDTRNGSEADEAAFAKALQAGTKAALTGYLKDYSQGRNVAAARAELMRLGFVEVAVGQAKNELRWIKAGGGKQDGETFKDCADCPRMVALPAGEYLMGSPEGEAGRPDDEGPQHKVSIPNAFAVGRTHVTRGEFAAFVKATGYKTAGGCYSSYGPWRLDAEQSWRWPGFDQGDDHPVICVDWKDASAYTKWLSYATNKTYRLMSEAETEYAARGTTEAKPQPRYFFGDDEKNLCSYANGADQTAQAKSPDHSSPVPCQDGYVFTAPVASYGPNAFGLYDVHGNAWSWTDDCWNTSYKDKPEKLKASGAAWTNGGCTLRVVRGGSWGNDARQLRSARRAWGAPDDRVNNLGLRLARTLTP